MKIAIIGAGGVGGYIGAKLKLSGENEVAFVARGKHLETMQREGLRVQDEKESFIIHPNHLGEDLEGLGVFDLIILAVKSYSLDEALEMISENIDKHTILLPLLNGVDHDLEVLERYPEARVLNGCIYIFSNIKEEGHIKKYGGVFHLFYGSRSEPKEQYVEIEKLFDATGLKHRLTDKIELETWRKYLLISAYASMTSYYKAPLGVIARDHVEELAQLLAEIKAVANAKGIALEDKNVQGVLERVQSVPFDSKTSMQLDFEAEKQAEVEALTGYIVREGQRLGIATPIMDKIYTQIG